MTLRQRQSLFCKNIGLLIIYAYNRGFELTFGEADRTEYQQREYVRTGRSQTMNSAHLERLAVDFNIFIGGRLLMAAGLSKAEYERELWIIKTIGDYWESLHSDNVWGGDWNRNNILDERFKDPYHFEMKR
jgi:hypothetical protein